MEFQNDHDLILGLPPYACKPLFKIPSVGPTKILWKCAFIKTMTVWSASSGSYFESILSGRYPPNLFNRL